MNGKVIYCKKYPQDTALTCDEHTPKSSFIAGKYHQSFNDFYQSLYKQTKLIPISNRKKESLRFIRLAIKIAKHYQLDTVIVRHDSHISVNYSFDCGGCMKYLKSIFVLADDYSFFRRAFNREITISLDYYTHYVIRNNRIIAP